MEPLGLTAPQPLHRCESRCGALAVEGPGRRSWLDPPRSRTSAPWAIHVPVGLGLGLPPALVALAFVARRRARARARARAAATRARAVRSVESTPSIRAFKFSLDAPLLGNSEARGVTFTKANAEDALLPPELKLVLSIVEVESLYVVADWVCVTRQASACWSKALVDTVVGALGGATMELDTASLAALGSTDRAPTSAVEGVRIRLQACSGVPIQLEAAVPGQQTLRQKLSARFAAALVQLQSAAGPGFDFFANRRWVDWGVRYDGDSGPDAAAALAAAAADVEAAWDDERLAAAARGPRGSSEDSAIQAGAALPADALRSPQRGAALAAVEALRSAADCGDSAAIEALTAFVEDLGSGCSAARMMAIAYLGTGGGELRAAAPRVYGALEAAFRSERSGLLRRIAGDALCDLGDRRAAGAAVAALADPAKLVRWRAARLLRELGGAEEHLAALEAASRTEATFEVAFEMAEAARVLRQRAASNTNDGTTPVGPIWQQMRGQ